MSRLPHHALRFVGVALVAFAGLGLWYNGSAAFSKFPADPSTPYFSFAFYTMSAICVTCHLTLLFVGVQFIRLKSSLLRLFIGVMVFEVVYFFSGAFFTMSPGVGLSIGAAIVVASGGLMLQFVVLFPLWGPLLAHWAKKRMNAVPPGGAEVPFPEEQVARPSDWVWAAVNFLVMLVVVSLLVGLVWRQLRPGTYAPGYLTLGVPVLLSAGNALASVRLRRKKRRNELQRKYTARLRAGLCPRCEYNLTGLPEPRCPECGTEFDPHALPE